MEQFFNGLKAAYNAIVGPPIETNIRILAHGYSALPLPAVRHKIAKEKPVDAFLENRDTNTWGFNQATADRHNEGSVDALTPYDVDALKDRNQWPANSTNRKVRAKMKSLWHSGATDKEIASACGCSESLVEKITAAFSAALSAQLGGEA